MLKRKIDTEAAAANCALLPSLCAGVLLSDHSIIIIKRGELGYYATGTRGASLEESNQLVDDWNEKNGITPEQRAACECGSMFGWDCGGARAERYKGRVEKAPKVSGRYITVTKSGALAIIGTLGQAIQTAESAWFSRAGGRN